MGNIEYHGAKCTMKENADGPHSGLIPSVFFPVLSFTPIFNEGQGQDSIDEETRSRTLPDAVINQRGKIFPPGPPTGFGGVWRARRTSRESPRICLSFDGVRRCDRLTSREILSDHRRRRFGVPCRFLIESPKTVHCTNMQ